MRNLLVWMAIFLISACGNNLDTHFEKSQKGDGGNNGGKGVECETPQGRTLELLDFYEANHLATPLIQDLGPVDATEAERFEYVMHRLALLDIERADFYRSLYASFSDHALFVEGPLEDIPDTGIVQIPSNCKLKQMAIRRKPLFPKDKRYIIDQGLWNRLLPDQRLGLKLHEFVYGEAADLGQKNSKKARVFTGYLASNAFSNMDQDKYELLKEETFKAEFSATFKQDHFVFDSKVGSLFEIKLKDLLKHQGSGNLTWALSEPKPQWLQLDTKKEKLTGVPTTNDIGKTATRLIVQDGAAGAITVVEIEVRD